MFSLLDLLEVPAALAADADAGDVQLLAGRRVARAPEHAAGNHGDRGRRRNAEETAARGRIGGRLGVMFAASHFRTPETYLGFCKSVPSPFGDC